VTRTGTTGSDGTVDIELPVSSAAGTYTLAGAYLGDPAAGYQASGASRPFTIGKAASKVTISCPTSVPYTGSAQEPCAARVTGVADNPLDDLDQPVLVTYTDNTAPGTATASAVFYGDAAHTGDTGANTFTIGKASQTITFGALGNRTYGDPTFTVSATADSGLTVTYSTLTTSACTVTSSGEVAIVGAGTCTITASQAGDANYAAAPAVARSYQVVPAFVRAEYTGDWFMYAGTAQRFSAKVYPAAAPDTGTINTIDYGAQGVTARVKVYPAADCGTTCATATPIWQTTTPVPVTNGAGGVGNIETFGPSTLPDGAYIVVIELVVNNNLLGERAVAAFGVTPSSGTYVVGGGAIPTANGSNNPDSTKGYFGFNVRKQRNSATGSMAFVYRQRINPTTGQGCGNLTSSTTFSTSCRDVDVMIRTSSVTSASTTQASTWPVTGTATGRVTVRFVDAISGAAYTGLTRSNDDFRFDAYDAAPGGAADQFGLTVYSALKPTASVDYSAAGTATGQTGTAAATTMTTISLGDISAPPGNR
jgi:hypothetical protein